MSRVWSVVCPVCIVILAPVALAAQGSDSVANNPSSGLAVDQGFAAAEPESADAFGTTSQVTVIHASRWTPWAGSGVPLYSGPASGYIQPADNGDSYWTQIDLPAGAVVTNVCFLVQDDTAVGGWSRLDFHAYESAFPNPTTVTPYYVSFGEVSTSNAATPGYVQACLDVTVTVRGMADLNSDGDGHYLAYALSAETGGTVSSDLALFGAAVTWHRSISPAPATATFSDVPVGAFGFQHIEALAASGITAGCGGGNFCPDAPLTRAQMAVFLAKGLGLHWRD